MIELIGNNNIITPNFLGSKWIAVRVKGINIYFYFDVFIICGGYVFEEWELKIPNKHVKTQQMIKRYLNKNFKHYEHPKRTHSI